MTHTLSALYGATEKARRRYWDSFNEKLASLGVNFVASNDHDLFEHGYAPDYLTKAKDPDRTLSILHGGNGKIHIRFVYGDRKTSCRQFWADSSRLDSPEALGWIAQFLNGKMAAEETATYERKISEG